MQHTLPSLYQEQIHKRHYARWDEEQGRRENWEETVDRWMTHVAIKQADTHGSPLSLKERAEIRDAILNLRDMPSMRSLMTAGPALDRDNVAGYNCAFVGIDDPRAFDETLFILCCGTGVGYSVEHKYITKLPSIPVPHTIGDSLIVVEDSKEGWADAFRQLIASLYAGEIPRYDTSKVRPAGSRLKTFGGRASGPQPLIDLFEFTIATFTKAAGRQLSSAEVHEIMCKIGDIVVVGGVRRSALISLYDPYDEEMAHIKDGNYWERAPHLRLANNSAAWEHRPDYDEFQEHQWIPLREGRSGEPGIINRAALQRKAAESVRRDPNHNFGVYPCGEIILRSMQFCNLSEIVARPEDTFEDLIEKVRIATIIGTIQSTLTNFRYLRDEWRQNCEEERLLGVSITGAVDNPILNGSLGRAELRSTLHALKHCAIDTNKEWAERFNINQSASITCNKPSGTVAKLVLSGPGINEWHDEFFIQRQRAHKSDPAAQVLYYSGVPCEDDLMDPENTWVFSWATKAPATALTRKDMPALRKLQLWLDYAEMWCEHNPSTTINVKDEEWDEAGDFVHEHFDRMAGVAFFPYEDPVHPQLPYESISEEEYHALLAETPVRIDWSLLSVFETEDMTEGAKELACSAAGGCDVDLAQAA
jgi:ribonucleoside-triphosphate reductase